MGNVFGSTTARRAAEDNNHSKVAETVPDSKKKDGEKSLLSTEEKPLLQEEDCAEDALERWSNNDDDGKPLLFNERQSPNNERALSNSVESVFTNRFEFPNFGSPEEYDEQGAVAPLATLKSVPDNRKEGGEKSLLSTKKKPLLQEEECAEDALERWSNNDDGKPLLVNERQSPNNERALSNSKEPVFTNRFEFPNFGSPEDYDEEGAVALLSVQDNKKNGEEKPLLSNEEKPLLQKEESVERAMERGSTNYEGEPLLVNDRQNPNGERALFSNEEPVLGQGAVDPRSVQDNRKNGGEKHLLSNEEKLLLQKEESVEGALERGSNNDSGRQSPKNERALSNIEEPLFREGAVDPMSVPDKKKKGGEIQLLSNDKKPLLQEEESTKDKPERGSTNEEGEPLLVSERQSPNNEQALSNDEEPAFSNSFEFPNFVSLDDYNEEGAVDPRDSWRPLLTGQLGPAVIFNSNNNSAFLFIPDPASGVNHAAGNAEQEGNQENPDTAPSPALAYQDAADALMEQVAHMGIYAENQDISHEYPFFPGPREE